MHRSLRFIVGRLIVAATLLSLAMVGCSGEEEGGGSTSKPADTAGGDTTPKLGDTVAATDVGGTGVDAGTAADSGPSDGGTTPSDGGSKADATVGDVATTCDPCTASSACVSNMQPDAKCADHGAAGAFCADPCGADDACADGFTCVDGPTVEGANAKLCLPTGTGDTPGACTCSEAAIAKGLTTTCWTEAKDADGKVIGKCMGQRKCEAGGLDVCDAKPASEELCNGGDDDCDGQTDEAGCDDGDPCTTDACKDGQCSAEPATGACDDGDKCTQGEQCTNGKCAGGSAADCDDGDACTTDACAPGTGCTHTPATGACDDGDKCTTGEACAEGKCAGGTIKTCDDGVVCTNDSCDATTGACLNEVGLGPCDDGDVCTTDSACGPGSAGKPVCTGGQKKDCDDKNPCTTDTCDAQLGCTSKANTSIEVSCYSGNPATKGVGLCKAGVKKCQADGSMGACTGEVLPAAKESCNGLDDDCNGKTDEGCAAVKYAVDGRLASVVVAGTGSATSLRLMVGGSTVAGRTKSAQGGTHLLSGFYSWLAK